MATAVVCVHIFLDALLTIGCLIILFAVMPGQDRVTLAYKEGLALIDSIASGPAGSKVFNLADIVISEKLQKAETFFLNEIFPFISRQALQHLAKWLDFDGKLHSPDLVLEQIIFVKVIIGVVILYGVLRCIMHVGVHVFVTSPVVLLVEERPEPVSLVFHIAVKTVALLIPYIIASISWIEFQVVIATMFGFIVKYSFRTTQCSAYASPSSPCLPSLPSPFWGTAMV